MALLLHVFKPGMFVSECFCWVLVSRDVAAVAVCNGLVSLVSYCFLVCVTVVSMVSGGVWFTSRFGFAGVCVRSWLV